jgi:hypothetical protein
MESNQMNSPDFLSKSNGKDKQIHHIKLFDFLTIEANVYVNLCYPGKTISEISELTGIPKNTVRWYVKKGTQKGKVYTTHKAICTKIGRKCTVYINGFGRMLERLLSKEPNTDKP